MEQIVNDLYEIREWYETFLDTSIDAEMMDSDEIAEYEILSKKFDNVLDKLNSMC